MTTDGTGAPSLDRRAFLGTIVAGSVVALAGCADDGVTEPSGTADEDDGGASTDDEGAQSYDAPVDELVDFPDVQCEVCAMRPANHPEWNAQFAFETGERGFCCTPGCAIAYYVVPETFGAPDAPLANFWATEFGTGEFVDGVEATYVLEDETGHIDQPMGRNPYPFAEEADAYALVEEYDHLEEADVVTIEEIDEEVASDYRYF